MQHTPAPCARLLLNNALCCAPALGSRPSCTSPAVLLGVLLDVLMDGCCTAVVVLLVVLTAAGQRMSHPLKVQSSAPE